MVKKDDMKLIANSEGQDLKLHCIAVGKLTAAILSDIFKVDEKIAKKGKLAGYMHDVGKAKPSFQTYIKKLFKKTNNNDDASHIQNEDKHYQDVGLEDVDKVNGYRHNQVSLFACMVDDNGEYCEDFIKYHNVAAYAIYNHHDTRGNKELPKGGIDDSSKMNEYCEEQVVKFAKVMLELASLDNLLVRDEKPSQNPFTKVVDPVATSSEHIIVKVALIQADLFVSKMKGRLNSDLYLDDDGHFCQEYLDYKNSRERLKAKKLTEGMYDYQKDALNCVVDNKINIISGNAGCGKTVISLGYFSNYDRKCSFMVAPRNTICYSLYETIKEDEKIIKESYNSMELIRASKPVSKTNEKEKDFNSELMISNIDSVLNMYFTHSKSGYLLDLLTQPMVVDEFHELICQSAIYNVFKQLLITRHKIGAKTLLISATPPPSGWLSDEDKEKEILNLIEIPYPDDLNTVHHFTSNEIESENVLIRRNTIKDCQELFDHDNNEERFIIHSLYDSGDKEKKISILLNKHGKSVLNKGVVHGTSMIECSLNVSFLDLISELSSPASLLQVLGRVLRFRGDTMRFEGKESRVQLVESKTRSSQTYIQNVFSDEIYKRWILFINENIINKTLKKSEVYELVKKFYAMDDVKTFYKEYYKEFDASSKEAMRNVKAKGAAKTQKINSDEYTTDGLRGEAGVYIGFVVNNELKKLTIDKKKLEQDVKGSNSLQGIMRELFKGEGGYIYYVENTDLFMKHYLEKELSDKECVKKARSSKKPIIFEYNRKSLIYEYDWHESDISKSKGMMKK